MRLLGRQPAAVRGGWWAASAVKAPTPAARPRVHHRLRLQPPQPEGGACSHPEPLLVCLPVLEAAGEAEASSSASSSSAGATGGPPHAGVAAPWQQLPYWAAAPPRLHPLVSFVEVREGGALGAAEEAPPPQLSTQPGAAPGQLFSVQLDEPQQAESEQKHKDYYANVGDCIRTLREDIPMLFARDLNYAIYREDMVFKDPRLSFRGLRNYRLVIWSLRFHGRLFFQQPYVEVSRIWQPEDNIIKMRWAVHGRPRLSMSGGTHYQFDGISTYKLDRNGKIYEHAIDNMQLRDPPITNPLLYGWNIIMQPLVPQQQPCPGAWYREEEEVLPAGSAISAGQQ